MNDIILYSAKINNTKFPCIISEIKYETLTQYVNQTPRKAEYPFSAEKTEKYRKNYVYTYTFSQNGCKARLIFTRYEDFYKNHYFTFNMQESNFHYCNHPVICRFEEAHGNCIDKGKIEQIQFQTKLGVPPRRIRTKHTHKEALHFRVASPLLRSVLSQLRVMMHIAPSGLPISCIQIVRGPCATALREILF